MRNNITVTRKYLEVGHTFMEGDSVHSKIESKIKKQDINVPADYIHLIKSARLRPFPYDVKNDDLLPFSFFKNYEDVAQLESIRPGWRTGDRTVNELKQIQCRPGGTVVYKLQHSDLA